MSADDAPYLTPSSQEAETLRLHVSQFDDRDAWQQSVCVAILRGHQTVDDLAAHLGVDERDIWHAVRPLLGQGLRFDAATGRVMLR